MTDKRRKVGRVETSIPAEWGVTPQGYPRNGKIISLSAKGCLLRTDHVEPLYGKTIYLRFPLPDDDWLALEGEALYYMRDVGFAVEFAELTDKDHYLLARLVQEYQKGDPYRTPGAAPFQLGAPVAAPFLDKRRHPRLKVSINVNWGETPACQYSGDKVTSLGLGGCFIETERDMNEGDPLYVRLWEMPGGKGVFKGNVRYQLRFSPKHTPVGLGVEFSDLTAEDTASLQEVLNFYGETLRT